MVKIEMEMPRCCYGCRFYQRRNDLYNGVKGCVGTKSGYKKLDKIMITKEKPEWCSLSPDDKENIIEKLAIRFAHSIEDVEDIRMIIETQLKPVSEETTAL